MAYKVDKFNGEFLTSVADGTIDSTTDLRFVGKNYAGYGEIQNENFLHLMENFANTSPPPKAVAGQIWYDTVNQKLRFYNGSKFKLINGAEAGSSQPSDLGVGEFWWNTTAKQLYIWSGTQFDLVGPEITPGLGDTSFESRVVKNILDEDRIIGEVKVNGKVIAVVSREEFNIKANDVIAADFPKIKNGITLINSENGITADDHRFWGTASNSDKLGGISAAEFIELLQGIFPNDVKFGDNGYKLGDINDLHVKVERTSGEKVIFERKISNNSTDSLVVRMIPQAPVPIRDIAEFKIDGIFPGVDSVLDLGSESKKWNSINASSVTATTFTGNLSGNSTGIHRGNVESTNSSLIVDTAVTTQYTGTVGNADGKTLIQGIHVGTFQGNVQGDAENSVKLAGYLPNENAVGSTIALRAINGSLRATQFIGVSDKADRLRVSPDTTVDTDSNFRSAKMGAIPNSIAARNSAGDLYAVLFQGTATAARYADLAEKYLSDRDYSTGTVVSIGGEKEVTESKSGDRAIGIVSENPAFMMNKDLEGGTYVALKGRVPCRVVGKVKKGQRLIADNNGCAVVSLENSSNVFAIALESSDELREKLIEVAVI